MNETRRLAGKVRFALCGALLGTLTGCIYTQPGPPRAYVSPPRVEASVSVGVPVVEIRVESDFYEPLSSYGRWEVVGSHGRCWFPGRVESNWRPYSNGNWERTDVGWYWASDEPWAWATYHYGRWDLSPQFGWYWVPQTQWAPAWVSWHEGGGYVGWAPLQPSARISVGGSVALNVALIAPRAFVFVEPRRFLEPVNPTTVVVNNTTIINQTVNITNIKVVNNTVINEGPRTQIIEQASGQRVQAVAVHELRRKQEAEVVARQQTATPAREKKEGNVATPVRSEAEQRKANGPLDAQRRAKESEAVIREQSQKSARELENKTQMESQRRAKEAAAKAQEEARSKAKESERKSELESQQRSKELDKKAQEEAQKSARDVETKAQMESQRRAKEAAAKAQAETNTKVKESERKSQLESQQRSKELDKKAQAETEKKAYGKPELRPRQEKLISEQDGTNMVKKAQKKNGKGKPTPPEDPPAPPKPSPC